jgi:hypothetical protein
MYSSWVKVFIACEQEGMMDLTLFLDSLPRMHGPMVTK